MTYQDTLNWMFSQLPMYQRQGKSAYKEDLSNTLKLAHHLQNPERKFRSIHVAGTNGKGSVVSILEGIAVAAGLKVCSYTSPHIFRYNERIKINTMPTLWLKKLNQRILSNTTPPLYCSHLNAVKKK